MLDMERKRERDIFKDAQYDADFYNRARTRIHFTRQYLKNLDIIKSRKKDSLDNRIDHKSYTDDQIEIIQLLGYILKKEGKKDAYAIIKSFMPELQELYNKVFGDIIKKRGESKYYA